MGKSQQEKVTIISVSQSSENAQDVPPAIPPRMKNKGPALPEKPPHIRAKIQQNSSQSSKEIFRSRVLLPSNIDNRQREVLVAASKVGRDRPVDKRQREPPKLLMPTSGGTSHRRETVVLPTKCTMDCISVPTKKGSESRKVRPLQPLLLIPRDLLPWGSAPVSYALWMQRDAAPSRGPHRREPGPPRDRPDRASATSARARSGSVTRSGSLTSQGSSSSDSETFPKSVLKKQKRNTATKGGTTTRKGEQKKNVTFNAFATVQLVDGE